MLNIKKVRSIQKARAGFSVPTLTNPFNTNENEDSNDESKHFFDNAVSMFGKIGTVGKSAMQEGHKLIGAGKAVNQLFSKPLNNFNTNTEVQKNMGASYGDSYNTISAAQNASDARYGFMNPLKKKRARRLGRLASLYQDRLTHINNENQDLLSMANQDYNNDAYETQINGGIDLRYGLIAKEGTKLDLQEWKPTIHYKKPEWKPTIFTKPVESMKQGGKTEELDSPEIEKTNQKNIIPEGALHKNKHHMENDDNITKKGIPVVDNDGEQQAEIELNEIIFTLEVTKKLEELYNKYYNDKTSQKDKDKYAIEAGQLLVKEILFNTEDRTGLINTLKQGGTINEQFS